MNIAVGLHAAPVPRLDVMFVCRLTGCTSDLFDSNLVQYSTECLHGGAGPAFGRGSTQPSATRFGSVSHPAQSTAWPQLNNNKDLHVEVRWATLTDYFTAVRQDFDVPPGSEIPRYHLRGRPPRNQYGWMLFHHADVRCIC